MRAFISPLLKLAAVGLLCVTVATLPPLSRFYLFELASHFRVQLAALGLFVCLMLCRDRGPVHPRWRRVSWRMLAVLPAALNAIFIAGWYSPSTSRRPESGPTPQHVRMLIANVHTSNTQYDKLLSLIDREQPDVVALVEVDGRWIKAIEALYEQYPDRIELPRDDNFGIAFYSRLYMVRVDEFPLGSDRPSAIEAVLWSKDRRDLTIVAAHTYPPMGHHLMKARNRQLKVLADRMASIESPRLLVGDLNISMFSPYYRDLARTTGLKNARQGFGILPTWPTRRPYLRIPIDHCLHGDNIEIRDCRVGPDIGSDHLPLIVDLSF